MKRPNIWLIKRVRRDIRKWADRLNDNKRRTGNRLRRDRSLMRRASKALNKRIDAAYLRHQSV